MKWDTEQKVRDAIRYGDGELLAKAVQGDRFLDYDELERFVGEQVGGYRHVSWRGVQVGATTVVDKFGRPLVTAVLVLLMAAAAVLNTGTATAQCTPECSQVPEPVIPIIGTACTDLYPWSCDAHQLYLPGVAK